MRVPASTDAASSVRNGGTSSWRLATIHASALTRQGRRGADVEPFTERTAATKSSTASPTDANPSPPMLASVVSSVLRYTDRDAASSLKNQAAIASFQPFSS